MIDHKTLIKSDWVVIKLMGSRRNSLIKYFPRDLPIHAPFILSNLSMLRKNNHYRT